MSVISLYYSTLATTVVPPLTLTINFATVSSTRYGEGSITSSPSSFVSVFGGRSPYTFSWTRIAGVPFTISFPFSPNTTFSTFLTNGEYRQGDYRCTVTDFLGTTASVDVSIILYSQPSDTGTGNPTPPPATPTSPPPPPPPPPDGGGGGGGTAPSVRDNDFIQEF